MADLPIRLLLTDDDPDDCMFFRDALQDLQVPSDLTTMKDGVELMHFLHDKKDSLPDVLFLDLNMPRKKGQECLKEIRQQEHLNSLPVIIFSTSYDEGVASGLYALGANYYIQKPGDFEKLKEVIAEVMELVKTDNTKPAPENFVLHRE